MDRHILKCLPFLHILSLIGPLLCYSIGEMPSLLLLDGHHYHFVSILFSLKNESYFASHITSARKYIIFLLVHVPVGRYTVHVHHMKILLLALDHTLYGTSIHPRRCVLFFYDQIDRDVVAWIFDHCDYREIVAISTIESASFCIEQ